MTQLAHQPDSAELRKIKITHCKLIHCTANLIVGEIS